MKRYIKSNTDKVIFKFEVGEYYKAPMLYGGIVTYKCVSRTANTVTLQESHISEDTLNTVDDGTSTHPIILHDAYKYELDPKSLDDPDWDQVIGKKELIETWEYRGEKGYLSARSYG